MLTYFQRKSWRKINILIQTKKQNKQFGHHCREKHQHLLILLATNWNFAFRMKMLFFCSSVRRNTTVSLAVFEFTQNFSMAERIISDCTNTSRHKRNKVFLRKGLFPDSRVFFHSLEIVRFEQWLRCETKRREKKKPKNQPFKSKKTKTLNF